MVAPMFLKPTGVSTTFCPSRSMYASAMLVMVSERTAGPRKPRTSVMYNTSSPNTWCWLTNVPSSATRPMRSESPSVARPRSAPLSRTTRHSSSMCGRIGSGAMPGNAGLTTLRISSTRVRPPDRSRLKWPWPVPYIESATTCTSASRSFGRSTRRPICASYAGVASKVSTSPLVVACTRSMRRTPPLPSASSLSR